MKKLLVCALCAAMVVPAFSVSVSADSKELVLYTWENMFPQEVLDGFEEETGIKVVYSNFDTDENMLEKLSMAKGGDYDVVVLPNYPDGTTSIHCIRASSMIRMMNIPLRTVQEFR